MIQSALLSNDLVVGNEGRNQRDLASKKTGGETNEKRERSFDDGLVLFSKKVTVERAKRHNTHNNAKDEWKTREMLM